ncbi:MULTISPECIES: hypothetical protein [unclassified Lentimonas]|uniref:hypothetical protein n=1 Tax=unclassified Lentimonas TaxID=2630993 RepID=UPI001322313E|nr:MULTISPECIES: hypothetical protein [unclassified Lentimonas]CAA6677844.1 Unannotated [Lentimonas sp. CC4]CAA6683947.1 Unannotated [Lentimonas sp. CC6]CAA6689953.1 Unannotated [Lentimonas sp. CC10]CAA6691030.1 Unannotated [Lentimonas sp. CC19]CAA7069356.1 Unannotated [Lentimonas sp. CC11]
MRYPFAPYFALFFTCLLALGTSGCQSFKNQRFVVNEATIQNDTEGTLHNVHVRHEPNGTVGATNAILPHKSLNVGFDGRTMMAENAIISWTDDYNQFHQKEIILPKNATNDPTVMHLHYRIGAHGKVTAEVVETH